MHYNYSSEADEAVVTFEVGSPSDWEISTIPEDKKVCDKFEGCYIPLYDSLFKKLGVRLLLNAFE